MTRIASRTVLCPEPVLALGSALTKGSFLLLLLLGTLSACGGGGGGGRGGGGVAPEVVFVPDFGLRQDVILGGRDVTDALFADFNGDGFFDVVETVFGANRVTMAWGQPDGTFLTAVELDVPGSPWRLATGDFGGDGLMDLAVATTEGAGLGTPAVVLFERDAQGAFVQTARLDLGPGTNPFDMHAVSLGAGLGDDLLVVCPDIRETWHLALTAPGSLNFVRSFLSTGPTLSPLSVVAIDVGGDADFDLVIGESGTDDFTFDRLVMFENQGDGTFGAAQVISPLSFGPVVRRVGDLNGDGFQDLGVAQLTSDRALLLLGTATGFGGPLEIDFGGVTSSLIFEDLDQDGLVDVAATLIEQGAVAVRLATSPLNFGPRELYNVGNQPRSLCIGSFPGSPELDLFCANVTDVSLLHGVGGGAFRAARGFTVGNEPQLVHVVDLDQDGFQDAISIDQFQRQIVFLQGQGDGTFLDAGQIPLTPTNVENAGHFLVEDFDANGMLDVMTSVYEDGQIKLLRNGGVLPLEFPLPNDTINVGNGPLGLAAGHLNGDAILDVVVANSGENTIRVLLGIGGGFFAPETPVVVSRRPLVVAVDDLDGDGHADVALSTGELDGSDPHVMVYAGDGTGSLSLAGESALPTLSGGLDLADLNGDGLVDIVASQAGQLATEVAVVLNLDGFQLAATPLTVGLGPGTVDLGDIDEDGDVDLLVPLRSGDLRIAINDGAGGFPSIVPLEGAELPVPHGTSSSTFQDVDGDGKPDLVMVSPRSPYLWVALNRGFFIES